MNFNDNKISKILIVDDLPDNVEAISTYLRRENYQTIVATTGSDALDSARNLQPDLILLDIIMPFMDGFETCEKLKSDPETKEIPIIFLTSRAETKDIVKGFELGAVDYITHPFNVTELLARVRTHLHSHQLQTALKYQLSENARLEREHDTLIRHELKNYLTPVHGYAEILDEAEDLDDTNRYAANAIFDGTKKVIALLDGLKELQDIELGNSVLSKVKLNLANLLQQAADDMNSLFEQRATVQLYNAAPSLTVEADDRLLVIVFHHLIKNALEYVCDLEDKTQREVRVHVSRDAQTACVVINNLGPVLSPEFLASFFDKFNADQKKGGTGLGTTYAQSVIKAHNGDIEVCSNETDGTTVTVNLPCI